MESALSEDMLTTDLADYLVRKGVPFRKSHHHAGQLIMRSEELKLPVTKLPLNVLKRENSCFEEDVTKLEGDFQGSCDKRDGIGGTSLNSVKNQIKKVKEWLPKQN